MKRIGLLIVMIVTMLGGVFASVPVMADEEENGGNSGASGAVILTDCAEADNGGGEGIICILRLVVDILSVGVGILAVLGIVITGIQYLTSGGNEEQMRKSKRRLFEIVIGLVVYVLIYAVLAWLLPGFGGATSGTPTS